MALAATALLISIALLASSVVVSDVVRYRLPDGQAGFTDDFANVPAGAEVLEAKLETGVIDDDFDTQLEQFAEFARAGRDTEAMEFLQRPDFVDGVDRDGHTVLFAAAAGSPQLLQAVLNLNVDIHHRDNEGGTALLYAAGMDDYQSVFALIEHGAEVNADDHQGNTPLIYAVMGEKLSNVNLLIDKGVDINHQDHRGATALFYAVAKGNDRIADRLMASGADPHLAVQGKTPLRLAETLGHANIAAMLRARGAIR